MTRSNCDDIYKKVKTLKILDIYELEAGCFIYKFFHNLLPQCFTESFELNSVVHQRQIRKCNNIHVPLIKKVIRNDIPVEIRSYNLTSFCSKLKKYLISKY